MKRFIIYLVLIIGLSSNAAAQWVLKGSELGLGSIRDSYFLNETFGWIVENEFIIHRTIDGGETWQCIDTLSSYISDIHFIDSANGWAIGSYLLLHSIDGGETWASQQTNISTEQILMAIYFVDANNGWIVGVDSIYVTNNGGQEWQAYHSPVMTPRSIFFIDDQTGWIVGNNGQVAKTSNGGANWTSVFLNSAPILYDVVFVNDSIGYAVGTIYNSGWQGIVCKSEDGGLNWDVVQLPGATECYSVSYTNDNNVWVCGSGGGIYKTSDGGTNWRKQETPCIQDLYSIAMIDDNLGFSTGLQGTILKTTNGGFLGIPAQSQSVINNLYPNPVHDYLSIDSNLKDVFFRISDPTGKCLEEIAPGYNQFIDVRKLPCGFYFLLGSSTQGTFSKKFIKD